MVGQAVDREYQWSQVVGRAWADDDFKQRLLADPASVLRDYDLAPPAGCRVQVLEGTDRAQKDTADVRYLLLPPKPSREELSEEELLSSGGSAGDRRCGDEWCHRCHRCYCEWCSCRGCHHPPRPEES